MSINQASRTGTNNGRRDTPTAYQSLEVPYVRPADWLALPTLTTATPKFAGLWAVFDNTYNNVSITCSAAGGYLVDWGDGTAAVNYATGATAQYNYTYSSISAGTLTTRGYKQVVITVTPVTTNGALNSLTLNTRPTAITNASTSQWLDMSVAFSSVTCVFNVNAVVGYANALTEIITIQQATALNCSLNFNSLTALQKVVLPATSVTAGAAPTFNQCNALRNAPVMDLSSHTSFNSMFANCKNLVYIPARTLTNMGAATTYNSFSNMFVTCHNLVTIPPIILNGPGAVAGVTCDNMFNGCANLVEAPFFNTINVTNMSAMFSGCRALTTVPLYNTVNNTLTNSMFQSCTALQSVPFFNTSKVTNTDNMFNAAAGIRTIPNFDFANVTSMNGMFASATSLTTIPAFNSIKNTNLTQTFLGCTSLVSVPLMNTSNVLLFTQTFQGCNALATVANLDMSNNQSLASCFASCVSLSSVEQFNTPKLTNISLAFNNCPSLITVPLLNTINVNNFGSTFQSCINLTSLPAFNMSNVTSIGTLLFNCTSIIDIPAWNFGNLTAAPGTGLAGGGIKRSKVLNTKLSVSYASQNLGTTELNEVFTNLGSANAAGRVVTVSGNPGADTALTKTSTDWGSSSSKTIALANTVGIVIGMQATNATSYSQVIPANTYASNNKLAVNCDADNGTLIYASGGGGGLSANTWYYVSNVVGTLPSVYDVSATLGGPPLTLSNGTPSIGFNRIVNSITTNVSVTMSASAATSGNGNIAFRLLNTNLATFKGWSVTG